MMNMVTCVKGGITDAILYNVIVAQDAYGGSKWEYSMKTIPYITG